MRELVKIYAPIKKDLDKIKKNIISLKYLFKDTPYFVIKDILSTEGKLLRPALLIFLFHATKNNEQKKEDLLRLGVAIELFHIASLVHDDVIDNSKLRRGKLTCQYRWGKDYAVLAGDLLLSLAWEIFSFYPFTINYAINVAKSMCEAKMQELDRDIDVDIPSYLELVKKKTSLMFSLSCYIGSKLAGGDEDKAINFGINFGSAYQIIDDCLDFISTERKEGKDINVDLREKRKFNLVLFYMNEKNLSLEESLKGAYKLAEEKLYSAYSYISHLPNSPYRYNLERLGDYILSKVKKL